MTRHDEQIAARIRIVCGERPIQEVARLTGTHAETARRYIRGQTPASSAFLAELCETYGVSADWLLRGRGLPTTHAQTESTLRTANIQQLFAAIADRIEEIHRASPPCGSVSDTAMIAGSPR